MAKAGVIINVAMVGGVTLVTYESGTVRKFQEGNIPKTVLGWMAAHIPAEPESIPEGGLEPEPVEEPKDLPAVCEMASTAVCAAPRSAAKGLTLEDIMEEAGKAVAGIVGWVKAHYPAARERALDGVLFLGLRALDIWDILARSDIALRRLFLWLAFTVLPLITGAVGEILGAGKGVWARWAPRISHWAYRAKGKALEGITAIVRNLATLWEGREELIREWREEE